MTIQEFVTRVADDRRRNIITYLFRSAAVEIVISPLPKEVRDEIFRGILNNLRFEYQIDVDVKGFRSKTGTIYHRYVMKGFGSGDMVMDKKLINDIHDALVSVGAHRPYGTI